MAVEGERLIEDVLLAVEQVPAGRVISYGDLAALCGTSPRRVGAILRDYGAGVAWWRVVNHRGQQPLIERARAHWQREQIIEISVGRCAITSVRADLPDLAQRWLAAKSAN